MANPIYRSVSFTNAFDRQEGLTHLPNWYYLTGSLPELAAASGTPTAFRSSTVPNGAMVAHSDLAFVIDAQGRERDALDRRPRADQTTASSFSSLLLSQIDQVLNFVSAAPDPGSRACVAGMWRVAAIAMFCALLLALP